MEASLRQKQRRLEFLSITFSNISPSPSTTLPHTTSASFTVDQPDGPRLRFQCPSSMGPVIDLDLCISQIFHLGSIELLCVSQESGATDADEKPFSSAIKIGFRTEDESKSFFSAFEQLKHGVVGSRSSGALENGSLIAPKSKFDHKIKATSAKMYFHYYGQLLHQQNMLQDYVRTGTYYAAVIENCVDFNGHVVVDVGAVSGILSLFATQVGAKHAYAVEASEMVEYACKLVSGNSLLGQWITVVKGKVEEVAPPEK